MKLSLKYIVPLFSLLLLMTPVHALMQTDFQILGVSTNLDKLGIVERWTSDGSGFGHCEARVYQRNRWEPTQVKAIQQTDTMDDAQFQTQCNALKNSVVKSADLQPVTWALAEMSPKPASIKDMQGHLIADSRILQNSFGIQTSNFRLPSGESWQIVTRQMETPHSYTFVLRPSMEPVPYDIVSAPYQEDQLLLSPLKMMINNHYGLITLIYRDARQGFEGPDYHYRPYFIKWPDVHILSVEEAKNTLMSASEYAMEPDELTKGPNSYHSSYRAYMRLKAEKLPVSEIQQGLEHASSAGKLYWFSLLYDQNPQAYQKAARTALTQATTSLEVIESHGSDWQSQPFPQALRQQAVTFNISL